MIDWTRRTLDSVPKKLHPTKHSLSPQEEEANLPGGAARFPHYGNEVYALGKMQDRTMKENAKGLKDELLSLEDNVRGITVEREWAVQVSGQKEL